MTASGFILRKYTAYKLYKFNSYGDGNLLGHKCKPASNIMMDGNYNATMYR